MRLQFYMYEATLSCLTFLYAVRSGIRIPSRPLPTSSALVLLAAQHQSRDIAIAELINEF